MFTLHNYNDNIKQPNLFSPQQNDLKIIASSFFQKTVERPEHTAYLSLPLSCIELEGEMSDTEFQTLTSSYGIKYANLVKARVLLGDKAFVAQCGVSDHQIRSLLSKKTQELWEEACQPSNRKKLPVYLECVQESVKQDILASEFLLTSSEQRRFLSEHRQEKLIVRSSSNEDMEGCINAGGNQSVGRVSATEEEVKKAIAQVVASYFSYSSIKNRLTNGDSLLKMPLCSVLLMKQVVEKESGEDLITSGVILTHQTAWSPLSEERVMQISATWGFGEGVVRGKVPCDEWIITEGLTYKAIRKKPFRLIAMADQESKEVANPHNIQEPPVLSDSQIKKLQRYALRIERGFKKPMDIEFVIQNGAIIIVQVRPVQSSPISNPNLLDLNAIAQETIVIRAKTFLSGANQVLSLSGEEICYAENLDKADQSFDPLTHRAVVIYHEPYTRNSHAEINFASSKTPIPCLLLSENEWRTSKALTAKKSLKLCPQTGTIVITSADLPVRPGLFLHPAHFSFSVEEVGKGLQGPSNDPLISQLTRQLTATPEHLHAHLSSIKAQLHTFFSQLSLRRGKTPALSQATQKIEKAALEIFKTMQQSSEKAHFTILSLHASMLRQLIHQDNPHILGSHSLSGLEAATNLPEKIERFIEESIASSENRLLCELALLAKKIFDESIQTRWLAFLRENATQTEENWRQLHGHLKGLDEIGMLSPWFAFHFKDRSPDFDQLSGVDQQTIERLTCLQRFEYTFQTLTEEAQRATDSDQLELVWRKLKEESQTFLDVGMQGANQNILDTLQCSKILSDLINLWDFNIKCVRLLKLYQTEEESKIFAERVNQFADWGARLCQTPLIHTQFIEEVCRLLATARELSDSINHITVSDSFFAIQHWIVPQGHGSASEIESHDQRLTIIHQNLMQAISLPPSKEVEGLLPEMLAKALSLFKENPHMPSAKRFDNECGLFFSLSDDCVKVKMNIPLNYHSFVAEFSQRKGSSEIEINAYWRASDKNRTSYLDFLQAFSHLTGISLKSFEIHQRDLQATFIGKNEKELSAISKAIAMTLSDLYGMSNPLKELIILIKNFDPEFSLSKEAAKEKVISFSLQRYLNQGVLPNFIHEGDLAHFDEHPVHLEVCEKVLTELKTESFDFFGSSCRRLLFDVLKRLSEKKRLEVIWEDLNSHQRINPRWIQKMIGLDVFKRLIAENPRKGASYYQEYDHHESILPVFDPFIQSLLTEYIEHGNYLTFQGVKKKQLEQLTEIDLIKVIEADFKGDQSIPPSEYPLAAFNGLRLLFANNPSLACSHAKKHRFRGPNKYIEIVKKNLTPDQIW